MSRPVTRVLELYEFSNRGKNVQKFIWTSEPIEALIKIKIITNSPKPLQFQQPHLRLLSPLLLAIAVASESKPSYTSRMSSPLLDAYISHHA